MSDVHDHRCPECDARVNLVYEPAPRVIKNGCVNGHVWTVKNENGKTPEGSA